MKTGTMALWAVIALLLGSSAKAETINYTVSGWQTTCWGSDATGVQGGGCVQGTANYVGISQGTVTGIAQFVGDNASGGMLTITTSTYVTSGYTPEPATFSITGKWFALSQTGDPAGLTVTTEELGTQTCTPTSNLLCGYASTDQPVANINLYGPGNTLGGTLSLMFTAWSHVGVSGDPSYVAWQGYTLTVIPEPGTALLLGLGLLGLAVSRRR